MHPIPAVHRRWPIAGTPRCSAALSS